MALSHYPLMDCMGCWARHALNEEKLVNEKKKKNFNSEKLTNVARFVALVDMKSLVYYILY